MDPLPAGGGRGLKKSKRKGVEKRKQWQISTLRMI